MNGVSRSPLILTLNSTAWDFSWRFLASGDIKYCELINHVVEAGPSRANSTAAGRCFRRWYLGIVVVVPRSPMACLGMIML